MGAWGPRSCGSSRRPISRCRTAAPANHWPTAVTPPKRPAWSPSHVARPWRPPLATEVILPKLGMNTESATIVAWRKREGDQVAVGEVLAEVETDKATIEP